MTKKLLLAAAAAGVMAFAGAANAGSISPASTVAAQKLELPGDANKLAPFTIASEAVGPTTAAAISGAAVINNTLTTAAFVTAGVKNTYEVIFTPSGGAFDGASTITVVGADVGDAAAPITVAYTQLGLRSDGTVAALVEVTGRAAGAAPVTGGTNVTAFVLNTNLKATSEADIKVAATVNLISSGVRIPVDTTSATTVAQFKPLLASQALAATPAAVANTTAALPDYKAFKTTGAPAASADLASAILLKANPATAYAGGKFFSGFNATEANIGSVVEGGTLTITGTAGAQLDKLTPSVGAGTIVADTRTDTTVQFTLGDNTAIEGTTGLTFKLTQPATALTLNAADYTVSFLPKFNSAYTAPTTAYGPVAAGSVALEGTNFTAPWFTLNNANNTAFLRLANNGTVATGPVFVTLKAHNGTAAPTTARVKLADSIAPNGVFQITGPELATLFGSNAQNGDLQVTIQGDGNVISGKVRVRNATGALSEQSLGTLGGK